MTDMFAKLGELLHSVDLLKEQEPPPVPNRRKKKKLKRKKKKPTSEDDGGYSSPVHVTRSVSPGSHHHHRLTSSQPGTTPHSIHCTSGSPSGTYLPSPSARKSAHRTLPRPHSALPGTALIPLPLSGHDAGGPMTAVPSAGVLQGVLQGRASPMPSRQSGTASLSQRPGSAAPRLHAWSAASGGGLSTASPPASPAGPSARAHAESSWRDISPPKYTATSLKKPELGTVPGKYQSPPWTPPVTNDRDPLRQEIDLTIKEDRFKHVLAVPAHVLAQSLYHPGCPSDRARARQLQQDLKTARMDKYNAVREKAGLDKQLVDAHTELADLRSSCHHLSVANQQLQARVTELLRSHKTLSAERSQLEEQLRQYTELMGKGSGDVLHRLLSAQQEIAALRQQVMELQQYAPPQCS